MAIRVIEVRGGYQFETTEGDEQPGAAEACRLIGIHRLDAALVHRKAEIVCRDGHGSVREQANHSVACERAAAEADRWERHAKTLSNRRRREGGREHSSEERYDSLRSQLDSIR